jgi:nucleoside-diphosphate-sugar epimerase
MVVSILGCGWLGLPLGTFLKEQGIEVKGTTTHAEKLEVLKQKGIESYHISLQPHPEKEQLDNFPEFLKADVLVIAIPPQASQQGVQFHPLQIRHLSEQLKLSTINKIIYISSTSVYPEVGRDVDENETLSQEEDNSQAVIRAEELLRALHRQVTILRCGGLMGYDRIPGKYIAGKKGVSNGETPVNFVHRDDVVRIIYEVIRQEKWDEVYNVVAPEHPKRSAIYQNNVEQFGYAAPELTPDPKAPFKLVKSDKLVQDLGYSFVFSNPLDFTYEVAKSKS